MGTLSRKEMTMNDHDCWSIERLESDLEACRRRPRDNCSECEASLICRGDPPGDSDCGDAPGHDLGEPVDFDTYKPDAARRADT